MRGQLWTIPLYKLTLYYISRGDSGHAPTIMGSNIQFDAFLRYNRYNMGQDNNFMKKIWVVLLITCLAVTAFASSAYAKKKSKPNNKYASLVMDADTGVILSSRHADKSLHPASLTKMMTLLLTFEALDRGTITMNSRVRISRRAASMVPSKLDLPVGYRIKVKDAIYSLVTKSANDVAVALAEKLGGSEAKFAAAMTSRARTIGMSKTRFRNASGLHHPAQVSSARDMAKLARYILQRYPHYYHYFSTANFTYRGKTYRSHNRLMKTYKGMDGFKTGYISKAGFNLVASAKQDGRRLIGVVFGGRSGKTRNAHMKDILDLGFKKASRTRIASTKIPPKPSNKPLVGLASAQPKDMTIRKVNTPKTATSQTGFTSLASLNSGRKLSVQTNEVKPNYLEISQKLQRGNFGEMMGEGDFDPAESKRIETGLIAIAMHKGDYKAIAKPNLMDSKSFKENTDLPSLAHPKDVVGKWAVQIGAFDNQSSAGSALRTARKKLPIGFENTTMMAVPLKTATGTIFRARLGGMTQVEANRACQYFKECIPVAPASTRVGAR